MEILLRPTACPTACADICAIQMCIRDRVDAYFAWAKQNLLSVMPKSKTANGFTYSLNPVSYTHLDVYKRQVIHNPEICELQIS